MKWPDDQLQHRNINNPERLSQPWTWTKKAQEASVQILINNHTRANVWIPWFRGQYLFPGVVFAEPLWSNSLCCHADNLWTDDGCWGRDRLAGDLPEPGTFKVDPGFSVGMTAIA